MSSDDANTVDSFDIPTTISTVEEAKSVLEAVDEDHLRWSDAVNTAATDLDEVLRDYHYAHQQLELARRRAGKARWTLRKHGFGDIMRPRPTLQGHRISYYGCQRIVEVQGGSIGIVLD